jgi:Sap, sulfolipid-1-addressing protein
VTAFAQAAGFAVLAALSPTALLVMAVFLGSANPRTTALLYVAGATLMTVVMAVAVPFILRGAGPNQPREHAARYGLRLGLGVLALASAAFVARRRGREPGPA